MNGRRLLCAGIGAALLLVSSAPLGSDARADNVIKKIKKASKKVKKAAEDAADDVADKAKDAGKAVADTAKDAAEAVADVAASVAGAVKKQIRELKDASPAEVLEMLTKAYDKLPKPLRALFNEILKGIGAIVGPLLDEVKGPFVDALKAVADPLTKAAGAFRPARRAVAQCSDSIADWTKSIGKSISKVANKATSSVKNWILDQLPTMAKYLGKGVATAFKLGMLELLTKRLSGMWATMKSASDWEQKVTLEEYKANPGTEPKSLAERMSGLKNPGDVAKASAVAILATIVTKMVQYPTAYLYGAASCVRQNKKSVSRDDYRNCYLSAFQKYSKDWFFELLTGSALAPLTPTVIAPVATWVGTMVTGVLANVFGALSLGVGSTLAPVIGMATVAMINTGMGYLISHGLEKAFFELYEKTSWKGTCPFFKSLVSADVIDSFGKFATGDSKNEAEYKCP